MPVHRLTQIDRERRTAVCSVCGPTKFYLADNRTHPGCAARVYCMTRIRESRHVQSRRIQERKRSQNSNWKPRHSLSEIDTEKMTAICSVCGPTDIRKHAGKQKGAFYICATPKRAYKREYYRSHHIPHPRKSRRAGHSLSEIDDKNKIAVCLHCGLVRIYVSHV